MTTIEKEISDIEKVKAYYEIIKDQDYVDADILQHRVGIITELEKILKTEFISTEDFHKKVQGYIANSEKIGGGLLQQKRLELGWSREVMGKYLRISARRIHEIETQNLPLNKLGIQFIHEPPETSVKEAKRRRILKP